MRRARYWRCQSDEDAIRHVRFRPTAVPHYVRFQRQAAGLPKPAALGCQSLSSHNQASPISSSAVEPIFVKPRSVKIFVDALG